MSLYLLLILPALTSALWRDRLSLRALTFVWLATSLLMVWLIPVGSRDYPTYLRDFTDLNQLPFADVVDQDPLYASVVWLFGHLGVSAEVFYLLFAICGFWVKLTALRRLSNGSSLVVLLYVCSYFFLHDFTQLRAGLAIGIWMHAIADLQHSRRRYLMLTALASLIHLQAALGFALFGVFILTRTRAGVMDAEHMRAGDCCYSRYSPFRSTRLRDVDCYPRSKNRRVHRNGRSGNLGATQPV